MVNYAAVAKKPVSQNKPIPGREAEMEKNDAGGYGFKIGDMAQLRRFLILGSAGGTYYVGEADHTRKNMAVAQSAIAANGIEAVNLIVDISDKGRAPNNKPALFALALATADKTLETRRLAFNALPRVARTASDLLYFTSQVNELRGWGRGLRRAVADWFLNRNPDNLAYQAMKYRQRDGWALSDLLRLAHPRSENAERNAIFKWIVDGEISDSLTERLVVADRVMHQTFETGALPDLIRAHKLPREVLPTESLNDVAVWEALMADMPGHAMLRNLGKMTSIGLLKPLNKQTAKVIATLDDAEFLRSARMHPLQVLLARHVYGQGCGMKGSLTWTPNQAIVSALDRAFYSAFDQSFATQKSALIAVDVSGSMSGNNCAGQESLKAIEGAAMMAMTLKRVIPNNHTIAFDTEARSEVDLSGQKDLEQIKASLERWGGGGTDCETAFRWALNNNMQPDAVIVITDNESWAGSRHAVTSLQQMRRNKPVKAINVAMTAIGTSILDSDDNLETVGFDASIPRIITEFMEGNI